MSEFLYYEVLQTGCVLRVDAKVLHAANNKQIVTGISREHRVEGHTAKTWRNPLRCRRVKNWDGDSIQKDSESSDLIEQLRAELSEAYEVVSRLREDLAAAKNTAKSLQRTCKAQLDNIQDLESKVESRNAASDLGRTEELEQKLSSASLIADQYRSDIGYLKKKLSLSETEVETIHKMQAEKIKTLKDSLEEAKCSAKHYKTRYDTTKNHLEDVADYAACLQELVEVNDHDSVFKQKCQLTAQKDALIHEQNECIKELRKLFEVFEEEEDKD